VYISEGESFLVRAKIKQGRERLHDQSALDCRVRWRSGVALGRIGNDFEILVVVGLAAFCNSSG